MKRFYRYLATAVLGPIICVAILSIFGESDIMKIGYGEGESCWIGSLMCRIIFYVVPSRYDIHYITMNYMCVKCSLHV